MISRPASSCIPTAAGDFMGPPSHDAKESSTVMSSALSGACHEERLVVPTQMYPFTDNNGRPRRHRLDGESDQCCQVAKFDPFLSLDCARVECVGAQSKERKGSSFAAHRSGAIIQKLKVPNTYDLKIWL